MITNAIRALFLSGGLIAPLNNRKHLGEPVLAWRTRSKSWLTGTQHSEERVLRAEAKRIQRRAKTLRAVAAGGYGPLPYAGARGGLAQPADSK